MSSTGTPGRSPSASARADKNKKQPNILTLKLAPKILRRFEDPSSKSEEQSTASAPSSPSPPVEDDATLKPPSGNDNVSESASTPAPTPGDGADASSLDGPKKRKGPLAGTKRSLGQMNDASGLPKARGKPGPKKKPRLDDGTIDHATVKPVGAVGIGAGHKLGPKANQGAINAGLRALDRSGKPCRKWTKKAFTVKSFTGVVWELPSWRGNERPAAPLVDESSEAKEISQQSSSDMKPNESDAALESNAGDQPDPMILSTPAASSPPPIIPSSSVIEAQG